jgi:glyoxylase-like metal-dependent hydrolase (beta-lactamase superfamily II)/rhodanese-related sulfurtransferase
MGPGHGHLKVVTYEAFGLGDRSYLAHDGRSAVVVDPQRDPAPYLKTLADEGLDVRLVLETHVHNDYLSGGLALSRLTGATYGIPAGEPVGFADECQALDEGDVVAVGGMRVKALSTPGHTAHHLSYWVEAGAGPSAVFTGGSLLDGGAGRTDLFGPDEAVPLAEAQWRSVRRLLADLPPPTLVFPTHGFGSFCATAPDAAAAAHEVTIDVERQRNPAAHLDVGSFVQSLLSSPLPVPAYYRYMAPQNRNGVAEPAYGPVPALAGPALAPAMAEGTSVVDLRGRSEFAAAHLRGALNLELGGSLTTYLGWLVPYTAPLVLVASSWEDVSAARGQLARIGREELQGWLPPEQLTYRRGQRGRYPVADFEALARRLAQGPPPTVVDVRFPYEWRAGHVAGAVNVPLPELGDYAAGLSGSQEIWVHCGAGFRAAVGASVLSARQLAPVLVDDDFSNANRAGLEVVADRGRAA